MLESISPLARQQCKMLVLHNPIKRLNGTWKLSSCLQYDRLFFLQQRSHYSFMKKTHKQTELKQSISQRAIKYYSTAGKVRI